jgi:hypothetical protein
MWVKLGICCWLFVSGLIFFKLKTQNPKSKENPKNKIQKNKICVWGFEFSLKFGFCIGI